MVDPIALSRAAFNPLARHQVSRIASTLTTRGAAVLSGSPSITAADFTHGLPLDRAAFRHSHHPVSTPKLWGDEFWRKVPVYAKVSPEDFISYRWSVRSPPLPSPPPRSVTTSLVPFFSICLLKLRLFQIHNTIQGKEKLWCFLRSVVPDEIPFDEERTRSQSKQEFLEDVVNGINLSTMAIRIT